ncbi:MULTISPECIES: SirB2 family protein [unclassified Undibacterium]|uniref:SirB2 family protein n=1 Tax=unclassified Undibacterium TaxID=2630295 RepID=UPI002AC8ED71|nr:MULTISPECIES: SirB2 family protein [unclassified Undibacterium]MEB0138079.1 SirB2 family protein [Undibacterium sp. CCC2.1]MEB0171183.1 SirB2 family protein [Undibacterium sp. CCC1.1]MEB0175228.1 SirB2 family protein [Undibacterium sp. CCC3.4]MEB0214636.1 SirB2 family protein [Undibacterium sp. 5I2]WPX42404.1 SirB2 family protein [Undibacterium sp. CCC3.4]
MNYLSIKHLHISLVILSGTLFLLRYFLREHPARLLQSRLWRSLPHVIDTLLLLCGLTLLSIPGYAALATPWLQAKLLALLLYIIFGSIAMKRGKTASTRRLAALAAVACFLYIVAVAISKRAIPFQ